MSGWSLILQGFLPLLVFVIVDIVSGLKWGVIAAVVLAIGECVWDYLSFGEVDPTTIVSGVLVLILGLLAVRLDNSKLFKFQPVIMAVIFAGILAYFQIWDEPLLVKMLPKMLRMVPEQNRAALQSPVMLSRLADLSLHLIGLFLFHGALVAWSALRLSNVWWLIMRGVGFWVLMFGLLTIEWLRWNL